MATNWPLWTERFVVHANPNSGRYYTVPAGRRVIVTSCCAASNAATGDVYFQVAGQALALFHFQGTDGRSLAVRIPAYTGEHVQVYIVGGPGLTGMIGGYLLEDTSGTGPPGTSPAFGLDDDLTPLPA